MTTRRQFLQTTAAACLTSALLSRPASAETVPSTKQPPIVLHQTDLFHPHNDPDDHFDLAVVYALAQQRAVDLRAVVLDYQPDWLDASPAVGAIAQMSYMTGVAAPYAVGSSTKPEKRGDNREALPYSETNAIRLVIETLEKAERPARILIAGSARDVATAAARRPELFREKCAGVYLNAGSAFPGLNDPKKLEYNVDLDPVSYAAMFDLPCPLNWFPCWHNVEDWKSGENSAYYLLKHGDAFAEISDALAGYFAYMFDKTNDTHWLKALRRPEEARWNEILANTRSMWCTASQLLMADKTVDRQGNIVDLDSIDENDALFTLEDIDVSCTDDGWVDWKYASRPTGRKILRVRNVDAYPAAMTKALADLLRSIGR